MKIFVAFFISISILNATSLSEARFIHKTKGAMKAIPLYLELQELNNVEAMNDLAKIFLKGDMVQIDIKRAYKILKNASKIGSAKSDYLLGKIYQSKKSPYYNKVDAYNSFVDSANNGYAKAQEMIGKYFLYGKVVDKDYEKALYYFIEASKQRLYTANCYIAYIYASGSGVFPNFGRANVFAKEQYKKGNKFCIKVWDDYNLGKYPKDNSWKVGNYLSPIK